MGIRSPRPGLGYSIARCIRMSLRCWNALVLVSDDPFPLWLKSWLDISLWLRVNFMPQA